MLAASVLSALVTRSSAHAIQHVPSARQEITIMKKLLVSLIAIGCLQFVLSSHAQVPGIINYQGRIVDNGTNFTGTGQFKFALVNGTSGTTNYWANDGTSVGQPSAAVSLSVAKGLYSLLLGDTTVSNMTAAIPASVFTNSDVRLRVWFNDGANGFQQLLPDQRIAAVGYAVMAASVPAGSITALQLASNAVTAASLAPGAVTAAAIANGAVGSTQLASNAINPTALVSPLVAQGLPIGVYLGNKINATPALTPYGFNIASASAAVANNSILLINGGYYQVTNLCINVAGLTNVSVIGAADAFIMDYVNTNSFTPAALMNDYGTNNTFVGLRMTRFMYDNSTAGINNYCAYNGHSTAGVIYKNCDFCNLRLVLDPINQVGGSDKTFVALSDTNSPVLEDCAIGAVWYTNNITAGTNVFRYSAGGNNCWLATHSGTTNAIFKRVTFYGAVSQSDAANAMNGVYQQCVAPDILETIGSDYGNYVHFGNLLDGANRAYVLRATGLSFPQTITNSVPFPSADDIAAANAVVNNSSPTFNTVTVGNATVSVSGPNLIYTIGGTNYTLSIQSHSP
jgi:hypothetical protein